MTDLFASTGVLVVFVLFFSAALQASTGFGYALLSAPLLAVSVGPQLAVSTIIATGVVVDLLILLSERRRPVPRGADVAALTVWSLPGLALGALVLAVVPRSGLQVLVAGAVLVGVGLRARQMRSRPPGSEVPERRWLRPAVALLSGTLSTATTLGAPPVVLYLLRRRRLPQETRDTLVALSLLRLPPSLLALVMADALRVPAKLPLLWLVVAGGYVCGRQVFARLDARRYERLVLSTLVVSATAATGFALT